MTDDFAGGLDGGRLSSACSGRERASVMVASAAPTSRLIGSAKAAEGSFSLRPDFRQPHRLLEARQPGRARDVRCGDRQDPGHAWRSRIHHPHRRRHPYGGAAGVRRRAHDGQARQSSTSIMPPGSMTSSTPHANRLSRALWQGRDRRLVFLRPRRRAFRLAGQRGRPQEEWPRLARARSNSSGSRTISSGQFSSTPIVLFAHIPLWMVAPEWGWGTEDSAQALGYLARFGSVTVLERSHPFQLMQKVEGNVTFHTARSTAFPQPAPGTAPQSRPQARAGRGAAKMARRARGRLFSDAGRPRRHRSGSFVRFGR